MHCKNDNKGYWLGFYRPGWAMGARITVKDKAKKLSWIRRKLGTLFGTRCPACFSKDFEVNYLLHAGRNFCKDCGHRWGEVLARRYDP
jgi:hypothetical protein